MRTPARAASGHGRSSGSRGNGARICGSSSHCTRRWLASNKATPGLRTPMSTDTTRDVSIELARARLRQSRAEIVELATALGGGGRNDQNSFPRSNLMRLATGRSGLLVASGAMLTLGVLRPGLLPLLGRLIPWTPLVPVLRTLLNRYLVRRNIE